jgi:hypothetical protein
MITISITDEVKNCVSGVYMLLFSDGRFYIGSSMHLKNRIKAHLTAIKSDFTSQMTCESLRQLQGFNGSVEILLIENVDMTGYVPRPCTRQPTGKNPVRGRELHHIHRSLGNPLLLNKIKKTNAKNKIIKTKKS